jgi:hypothetical protein
MRTGHVTVLEQPVQFRVFSYNLEHAGCKQSLLSKKSKCLVDTLQTVCWCATSVGAPPATDTGTAVPCVSCGQSVISAKQLTGNQLLVPLAYMHACCNKRHCRPLKQVAKSGGVHAAYGMLGKHSTKI